MSRIHIPGDVYRVKYFLENTKPVIMETINHKRVENPKDLSYQPQHKYPHYEAGDYILVGSVNKRYLFEWFSELEQKWRGQSRYARWIKFIDMWERRLTLSSEKEFVVGWKIQKISLTFVLCQGFVRVQGITFDMDKRVEFSWKNLNSSWNHSKYKMRGALLFAELGARLPVIVLRSAILRPKQALDHLIRMGKYRGAKYILKKVSGGAKRRFLSNFIRSTAFIAKLANSFAKGFSTATDSEFKRLKLVIIRNGGNIDPIYVNGKVITRATIVGMAAMVATMTSLIVSNKNLKISTSSATSMGKKFAEYAQEANKEAFNSLSQAVIYSAGDSYSLEKKEFQTEKYYENLEKKITSKIESVLESAAKNYLDTLLHSHI